MKIFEIAAAFVDLALTYNWGKVDKLSDAEIQVLFTTVSAAGFEPGGIVPGKLSGDYLDQDGSVTGETYPINDYCPYVVVCQDGSNNYRATGWLDQAIRFARDETRSRQEHVKAMQREIERSVPLKPIRLTDDGDMLREYPPSRGYGYFVDHTRDNNELSSCVGVHEFCNCWMDRKRATEALDAVVCRGCHLRVLFPKKIKTYGHLREHLESKLALTSA